jgi:hypothetical protein
VGLDDDDPAITQLRDLYLAEWHDDGSTSGLLDAFYLADRVGRVARALTWRLVSHLPGYAEGVPRWSGQDSCARPGSSPR